MTNARDNLPAAFAGLVATGAAIATGELLAGLIAGVPSPILSVGRIIVDLQPPGAKELVVSLFGTADKLALEVLVLAAALAIGAGLGLLARGRAGLASTTLAAFVVLGAVAGLRDPDVLPAFAVAGGLAELAVGATALDRLLRLAGPSADAGRGNGRDDGSGESAVPSTLAAATPDWSRRMLLLRGGGLAFASIAAGAVGRTLLDRQRVPAAGSLPAVEAPAGLPAGADFELPGLTPIVVPTEAFYRI
ncbi:MAG TPA: hypothetical protein VLS28_09315, partial [Candidatus Sulfomarinibacteraceae bacterium]|nr:hypothetical protein [Candidatus Sulfomarinibacteraceae bacterium]